MREFFTGLSEVLEKAITKCESNSIALSGGLDSSIIAYYLRSRKPSCYTIISKDFLANDLTYCQLAARTFELPLEIKMNSSEEILSALEETIKILKNFNVIEIRNQVVVYLVQKAIKEAGKNSIITGDGADELFAGYAFFLKKSTEDLEKELQRIWAIMHFPSIEIGKALGIKVENPFLDENVLVFAKSIPGKFKVRIEHGKKFGKWILRKLFEDKIPRAIAWREKSAMQDGAGTSGLSNLFNSLIGDEIFEKRKNEILQQDDVIIRSKESLHYYELFRKYYQVPAKMHSSSSICPFCKYSVGENSKFCRMCGAYPL